jgi:hypothetical protein
MVCPGTLFIGDNGAFLCIPMNIGVNFEHWRTAVAARDSPCAETARCPRWFWTRRSENTAGGD